jgi:hypothetical protein
MAIYDAAITIEKLQHPRGYGRDVSVIWLNAAFPSVLFSAYVVRGRGHHISTIPSEIQTRVAAQLGSIRNLTIVRMGEEEVAPSTTRLC